MAKKKDWGLSKEEEQKFISALTRELAPLRAKIGISQMEISTLIGVSRQTYSAVEGGKKPMSWSTYLSLILLFDYNYETHQMIRNIGAFPDELVERFNTERVRIPYNSFLEDDKDGAETAKMIKALDKEGIHALKTVLLLEYGRCTNSISEIIMRNSRGSDKK